MVTTMLNEAFAKIPDGTSLMFLYLQELRPMEHFKRDLVEYLDYCNNRRIRAKLKGLLSVNYRQQAASPFGCLNKLY